MKEVVLSPKAKKELQGCYLISGHSLLRLSKKVVKLTKDNFRVFLITRSGTIMELNFEDFLWYNPKSGDRDFKIIHESNCGSEYISRNGSPKEVVKFLDKVIMKKYKNQRKR